MTGGFRPCWVCEYLVSQLLERELHSLSAQGLTGGEGGGTMMDGRVALAIGYSPQLSAGLCFLRGRVVCPIHSLLLVGSLSYTSLAPQVAALLTDTVSAQSSLVPGLVLCSCFQPVAGCQEGQMG